MEIDDAEKHSDPLDEAKALTDRLVAAHIEENARKLRPQQERNPDGSWPRTDCIECGDAIPEKRLQAGRVRCVDCQEELELMEKRR